LAAFQDLDTLYQDLIQKSLLPRAQALGFNRQACLRESGDSSSARAI